jgi:hypothetical protein
MRGGRFVTPMFPGVLELLDRTETGNRLQGLLSSNQENWNSDMTKSKRSTARQPAPDLGDHRRQPSATKRRRFGDH